MRLHILHHCVIRSSAEAGAERDVYSGTGITSYRDGDNEVLMCAFRVGATKTGRDGRVLLYESRDTGKSWRQVPSPLDDEHVGSLDLAEGDLQLAGPHIGAADGTVILAAARMRVVEQGSSEYFAPMAGIVDAECVLVRFADGVWSEPVLLDGRRTADEWAIPCGSPVCLGGGRWLAPAERHTMVSIPEWLRGYHAFELLSHDDGRSWSVSGPMLNDPDRIVVYYDQHVARFENGRLLSLAWVHDVLNDATLDARCGWSDDDGVSWTGPFETHLPGGPVVPAYLGGGVILVAYPHRRSPQGVRVCVSTDGGETWDLRTEIVVWDAETRSVVGLPDDVTTDTGVHGALWDTMWGWSFGMPTLAALRDGTVGLTYYAIDTDGAPQVCFARLALDRSSN